MVNITKLKNNIVFILFLLSVIVGNVFYSFIYTFTSFTYTDEIIVLLICLTYFIFKFSKEASMTKEFFIFILISVFYLFYSILIDVTVIPAILSDYQQEMKPFLTFYCVYGLGTYFNKDKRQIICKLCILLSVVIVLVIITDNIEYFFTHHTNLASASLILSYTYYYFSSRSKTNLIIMVMILCLGLFSERSKFYGEFLVTILVILFIRKEIKFSLKYVFIAVFMISSVLYVSWEKFSFYFVNNDTITKELARPVLYKNAGKILLDYFPLGSGLGTYGNEASRVYYSPLYSKYKMDDVWGLSKDMDRFVADTYFPILCQFGIIGVLLFILFWKKVYDRLHLSLYQTGDIWSYKIGILIIIAIMIESIADTMLVSNRGVGIMMLLAIIVTPKKQ